VTRRLPKNIAASVRQRLLDNKARKRHTNYSLLPFYAKGQTDKKEWLIGMRPSSEVMPTLIHEENPEHIY
jgi:hypothetical protein